MNPEEVGNVLTLHQTKSPIIQIQPIDTATQFRFDQRAKNGTQLTWPSFTTASPRGALSCSTTISISSILLAIVDRPASQLCFFHACRYQSVRSPQRMADIVSVSKKDVSLYRVDDEAEKGDERCNVSNWLPNSDY